MKILTNGMTNSEIVRTPKSLLGAIQKQVKFLAKMHAVSKPCPNCGKLHNLPEAAGVEFDDFNFGTTVGINFKCIGCGRTLIYTLPWPTGDWFWSLDTSEAKPLP